VTVSTTAVTDKLYDQVPVSPRASESVPDTPYVPAESGPVVEIKPDAFTRRPTFDFVVTKVTAPVLSSTDIGPAVNAPEEDVSTVPVVGDVWVSVVVEPDFATVKLYVQVPVSPYASESVPVIM
jgi:hypothetical protein